VRHRLRLVPEGPCSGTAPGTPPHPGARERGPPAPHRTDLHVVTVLSRPRTPSLSRPTFLGPGPRPTAKTVHTCPLNLALSPARGIDPNGGHPLNPPATL